MMGNMHPLLRMLPALLAMGTALCGSNAANSQADALHTRFDSLLTEHGVVGGGFAFVHAASPATEFFLGEADSRTPRRVNEETAYNWASIPKTLTAIAILQLRDRGRLSLDDATVKYVPEL